MSPTRIDDITGLPLGPLPEGEDSAGYVGISYRAPDPRCRRMCTSPNRSAGESPAKLGTESGTGRKVVYCPCCEHELVAEEVSPMVANERPANLNAALTAGKHRRFVDGICGYDVVLLWDVKESVR